jgi:hypothetical protein
MTTHSNIWFYSIISHEMYRSVLSVVILDDYLDYKSLLVVKFEKYIKNGF